MPCVSTGPSCKQLKRLVLYSNRYMYTYNEPVSEDNSVMSSVRSYVSDTNIKCKITTTLYKCTCTSQVMMQSVHATAEKKDSLF